VEAACALGLLEVRSRGRIGLGAKGAAIMGDAGIIQMIEHNALLYRALADPMALLRGETGTTELGRYFAYASTPDPASLSPAQTGPYTTLMSCTVEPLADEVFDAGVLPTRGTLVDVGGGDGHFAVLVAKRQPGLSCVIFDLPSVVDRAGRRIGAAHLSERVRVVSGDFHKAPLPESDVVTLVRVLLDHDDDSAAALLASIRRSLRPGGRVVIVEPLAGARDARGVGEVYFALYLAAMGQGRARRPEVIRELLASAGVVAGDAFECETVERVEESLTLFQDGQPREAGLIDLQHQPFEEPVVITDREAVFAIVIGAMLRMAGRDVAVRHGHLREPD
jgi:demethylspheroidene O-methyltransferase